MSMLLQCKVHCGGVYVRLGRCFVTLIFREHACTTVALIESIFEPKMRPMSCGCRARPGLAVGA